MGVPCYYANKKKNAFYSHQSHNKIHYMHCCNHYFRYCWRKETLVHFSKVTLTFWVFSLMTLNKRQRFNLYYVPGPFFICVLAFMLLYIVIQETYEDDMSLYYE